MAVLWVSSENAGTVLALLGLGVLLVGGGGVAMMWAGTSSGSDRTWERGRLLARIGALGLVPFVTLGLSMLG